MNLNPNEITPAERKLIEHFGFDDIADHVDPSTIFRIMAQKAFTDNDSSPAALALRRGLIAWGTQRGTPEWEKLLEFT